MIYKRCFLIYCCFAMLALTACSKKIFNRGKGSAATQPVTTETPKVEKPAIKPKYGSEVKTFIPVTVVNFKGRDGCDFALQLENGEYLEPNGIPIEFQKDGLKVLVKFKIRYDVASICMIGKMIEVTKIKLQ